MKGSKIDSFPFWFGACKVDEAIRKAGVLIEALSWIRQFRDQYVVIKLGGSAQEDLALAAGARCHGCPSLYQAIPTVVQ